MYIYIYYISIQLWQKKVTHKFGYLNRLSLFFQFVLIKLKTLSFSEIKMTLQMRGWLGQEYLSYLVAGKSSHKLR